MIKIVTTMRVRITANARDATPGKIYQIVKYFKSIPYIPAK